MSYRPAGSFKRPNRSALRRCFACGRRVAVHQLAACLGTCKRCIALGAPRFNANGERLRGQA